MFNYKKIINLIYKTKKIILNQNLRNDIKEKSPYDYVTAIDTNVSNFLKTHLHKLYPSIGFVSEEDEITNITTNRWILDPIDGTTNLIFDYKLSTVSLGLLFDNEIIFGIVYNPFLNEMFYAIKNQGSYLNNKKLNTSTRNISTSLIEFGAGCNHKNEADNNFNIAKEIFKDCLDIRRICSSALSISYIAAQRIDGYFEKYLYPWDYAAASLILKEAGGLISDWSGNTISFENISSIVASNKENYNYLLKQVKSK